MIHKYCSVWSAVRTRSTGIGCKRSLVGTKSWSSRRIRLKYDTHQGIRSLICWGGSLSSRIGLKARKCGLRTRNITRARISTQTLGEVGLTIALSLYLYQSSRKMSWRSHGRDNTDMVDALRRNKIVNTSTVVEAMKAIDRGFYCKESAYMDAPQSIGAQATISAPHMHGFCMELMKDHLGQEKMALDVGSGSGYLTAVMSYMNRDGGKVIGLEHIPKLVSDSLENCKRDPVASSLMKSGALQIMQSDGRIGYEIGGPYDCIHVGAASPEIPKALTDQLKIGGRLVIPVGKKGATQQLVVVDKICNRETNQPELRQHQCMSVVYVPLTSADQQLNPRWH